MKQILYILVLVLCSNPSFCQKEKNKWIIIDTFIIAKNFVVKKTLPTIDNYFCKVSYQTNGRDTSFEEMNDAWYSYTDILNKARKPFDNGHYVLTISLPENVEIRSFRLKMDDKGSMIEFENLGDIDTFHIAKWTLFHNCLRDSVNRWIGFYNNDSLGAKLYKEKKRNELIKTGCNDTMSKYSFIMNGKSYQISILIDEVEQFAWYHGDFTKKDSKKRETDYYSKYKYWAKNYRRRIYLYDGTVSVTNK